MVNLSRFSVVAKIHRVLVFLIQRSGSKKAQLFSFYKRAWNKVGRYQNATTRFGAKIDCDLWDRIPRFIFHFGHWEPNISHWIAERLRPGEIFVDVGANLGYYTLLASRLVGPTGKVVAIEASPSIANQLSHNIAENGCTNVRVCNVAVADKAGYVTMYSGSPYNTGATSTLPDWRDGVRESEVSALPLHEILTEDEARRVKLLKIDVEGAEPPILRQIAQTIQMYSPNMEILVECSCGDDSREWEQLLRQFVDAGFAAFEIENQYSEDWYLQWRRPSPPRPFLSLSKGQTDIMFTRGQRP